jgi:hypothetical protein
VTGLTATHTLSQDHRDGRVELLGHCANFASGLAGMIVFLFAVPNIVRIFLGSLAPGYPFLHFSREQEDMT